MARIMQFGFVLWIGAMFALTLPYFWLLRQPPDSAIPTWARASVFMWWLSLLIIPVTLTLAVLRYRLWDLGLVVNRALVYGGLTAIVVAIYILVVGTLGTLFQTQGNLFVALLATGVVAVDTGTGIAAKRGQRNSLSGARVSTSRIAWLSDIRVGEKQQQRDDQTINRHRFDHSEPDEEGAGNCA